MSLCRGTEENQQRNSAILAGLPAETTNGNLPITMKECHLLVPVLRRLKIESGLNPLRRLRNGLLDRLMD
jgi:hypothetical protein